MAHLPEELKGKQGGSEIESGIRSARDLLEIRTIQKVLQGTGNNPAEASTKLGIHKSTFYRKIKKLGIPLPSSRKKTSM